MGPRKPFEFEIPPSDPEFYPSPIVLVPIGAQLERLKGKMATIAKLARVGKPEIARYAGTTVVIKRHDSSNVTLANYKRGTGGRSSFNGVVATVFGANGLIGNSVVAKLGREGTQVIVPYRRNFYDIRNLRVCGDLGQILYNKFHLKDYESLLKVLQYSNVCINLIGQNHETRNFSFEDVHVTGARNIAKAAKECGVEKFLHVSHLNAGVESSNVIQDGCKFYATKLEGENAVREEFPDAVVMRPSDVLMQYDKFLHHYVKHPHDPVWQRGAKTLKMPITRSDLTDGIMAALKSPDSAGKTYQCFGPEAYTLGEIIRFARRSQKKDIVQIRKNLMIKKLRVRLMEYVYMRYGVKIPTYTLDRMERESVSDRIDPNLPTLADLDVNPQNVEEYMQWLLQPWLHDPYYKFLTGQKPVADPPVRASEDPTYAV